MTPLYYLYATTIFLSSFLLFQVQPLMGKHILPWFGGSSAVWITAMFFFMIALALGYLYAQLLSWFSRSLQLLIHGCVLLTVGGSLIVNATLWPSAITPLISDVTFAGSSPVAQVFLVLTLSIGLPFVLLSSSSSLLQYWYGRVSGQEPFSLYAVSNVGSLLGLFSYPLLFERFLPTIAQGSWWGWGVGVYIACLILVMMQYAWATTRQPAATVVAIVTPTPSAKTFLWWTAVASVPVATMLAGTSFITGYVAAIPFLWIVPLGLYLVSFIVSFRPSRRLPMVFNFIIVLLTSFVSLVILILASVPVPLVVTILSVAMFAVYHLCHEALYAARPDSAHLTRFYVALSFGGIIASAVILVSTLYVLKIPIEFLLILVVAGVYSCYWLVRYGTEFFVDAPKLLRPAIIGAAGILVLTTGFQLYQGTQYVIGIERNFFGYKAVMERPYEADVSIRTLVHGTTNHGYQFMSGPLQFEPVAYYSDTSGIAAAFTYQRSVSATASGLAVAVAGLGAGALSAHCEAGDTFTFYEIDPQVITLAEDYFTYLPNCPGATVVLGDARLKLAEELPAEQYNLIILDAYADDMMPIHLMTAEAIGMYLERLAPGGILAIHISSRYLDLRPVIHGLSEFHNLRARYLTDTEQASFATPSLWTLLAKDEVFNNSAFVRMEPFDGIKTVLWTDTYSTIFPLLRWW